MSSIRLACFAIAALSVVTVLVNIAILSRALYVGAQLAEESRRFESSPLAVASSEAENDDDSIDRAVLVLGDSTAVGTGADSPLRSVPGRIATNFPTAHVENRAQDGAVFADVEDQLQRASRPCYDVVLIMAGGNDALRLTSSASLRKSSLATLGGARELSAHTILLTIGDLGAAPAIPWPLSFAASLRARSVRSVLSAVATSSGTEYVDMLLTEQRYNPFEEQPADYYARDGLHPSGRGYGAWYRRLADGSSLAHWLRSDGMSSAESDCSPSADRTASAASEGEISGL